MRIIDYFKDYLNYYFKDASVEQLLEQWLLYTENKLELQNKCINDYESCGLDYKKVAYETVFNETHKHYPKMLIAYDNLLKIIGEIVRRIKQNRNIEIDINIVLYHGLGNGAGWASIYQGKYSVLFGIEKIAQLNWHEKPQLEALVSHEMAHIIHFYHRGFDDFNIERNLYQSGIWQLYVEGFAQFYQSILLDKSVESRESSWAINCQKHLETLKALYLTHLKDEKIGCKHFFGDWFKVMGISDVGYYLGQQLIEILNNHYSMKAIAVMKEKEIEEQVLNFLKEK